MHVLFAILTAFLITFLTIPVVINVVKKNRSLAEKASNREEGGRNEVPTLGGVAIFAGVLFSILFWIDMVQFNQMQSLLTALLVVFFVGVVDDVTTLSPRKKIVGQLLAILIVVWFNDWRITSLYGVLSIHELPYWASLLLTTFTMIVITNAFNLIDGVDGLAGGVGVVSSTAFGFLFLISGRYELATLSLLLTGSLLAFIRFNFYPAKIFMGDTGSLVIGFLLSVFAINIVESNIVFDSYNFDAKGSALAVAILIVPLYDTLRIFIIRAVKGKSPFAPDKNHIHHNLADLGFGHRRITLYLCLVNVMFIALVIGFRDLGVNYIFLILLSIATIISYIPKWVKNKG